jgi:hypothetical protein
MRAAIIFRGVSLRRGIGSLARHAIADWPLAFLGITVFFVLLRLLPAFPFHALLLCLLPASLFHTLLLLLLTAFLFRALLLQLLLMALLFHALLLQLPFTAFLFRALLLQLLLPALPFQALLLAALLFLPFPQQPLTLQADAFLRVRPAPGFQTPGASRFVRLAFRR